MKIVRFFSLLFLISFFILTSSFDNSHRGAYQSSVAIKGVDSLKTALNFLTKIQGRWTGINSVAGINYSWFSFDYRAIGSSHVHGIYEGGSMGNLFTSFFLANFKGKQTIMARNGGVLNGIYRTSYFVMDSVHVSESKSYYRLVDAAGGKEVMYMDLLFKNDSLYWNSYTSGLGTKSLPKRHMTFKGILSDTSLIATPKKHFKFPQVKSFKDFPDGFDKHYLYMKKSASFLAQGETNDITKLAKQSWDPIIISDYEHIAKLKVNLPNTTMKTNGTVLLHLSTKPLSNETGFIGNYESVIMNPLLTENEKTFEFTYLHPGVYFITAVLDLNNDYAISAGDLLNESIKIEVLPNSDTTFNINNLNIKNKQFFTTFGFDNSSTISNVENDDLEKEALEINRTITYQNDVKRIISNNCITCHSGPAPSAGLDLSNYENMTALGEKLIKRMNNNNSPMPPSGKLSINDRLIVYKWLKDGSLKN